MRVICIKCYRRIIWFTSTIYFIFMMANTNLHLKELRVGRFVGILILKSLFCTFSEVVLYKIKFYVKFESCAAISKKAYTFLSCTVTVTNLNEVCNNKVLHEMCFFFKCANSAVLRPYCVIFYIVCFILLRNDF